MSSILLAISLIIAVVAIFFLLKNSKREIFDESYKTKEGVFKMFKSFGWSDRMALKLGVKHCENMGNQEIDRWNTIENRHTWYKTKRELEEELKAYDLNNKIIISTIPLSVDKSEVLKMASNEESLVQAIKNYAEELQSNKIEIFHSQFNILITEKGYYLAFYEKDLVEKV